MVRRITTTSRQYSIVVMLMLMAMLAMAAVAALGVFASPPVRRMTRSNVLRVRLRSLRLKQGKPTR